MSKNPFYNAVLASGYIVAVAFFAYYGPKESNHAASVLLPVAVLSLFVLSAAVMGYLFLFEPVMLFLSGNKTDAVNLFLKTVAIFACITLIWFLVLAVLWA